MKNQQEPVELLIPQSSASVQKYVLKNNKLKHYSDTYDLISKLPNSANGTDSFSKLLAYLGLILAISDWISDINLSYKHFVNQNYVISVLTISIVGLSGFISWVVHKFLIGNEFRLTDPVRKLRRLCFVKFLLNIPTLQTLGSALETVIYENDPADFEHPNNIGPRKKPYFRYEIKNLDQIHRQRNLIFSTIEVVTEALPQAYLQLYIIFAGLALSNEFIVNWEQTFSIVTSITCLASCALKLYITKNILLSKHEPFNLTSQTDPELLILPPLLIRIWIYAAVFGKYFFKYCSYAFSYIVFSIGISNFIHPGGSFFILILLIVSPRFLYLYYSDPADKKWREKIYDLVFDSHLTKSQSHLYYYYSLLEPIIYYLAWLAITLIIHRRALSSQYSLLVWISIIVMIPFILQYVFSLWMLNYGVKLLQHWQKPYKILKLCDKMLQEIPEGTYDRSELLIQPVQHKNDKTEICRKIIKFYNFNCKKFSMKAYIQNELIENSFGGALVIEFTMIKLSELILFHELKAHIKDLLDEDIFSYICLKYSSKGDKVLSKLGKYFIFFSDSRLQYLAKEFLVKYHNEIEMQQF